MRTRRWVTLLVSAGLLTLLGSIGGPAQAVPTGHAVMGYPDLERRPASRQPLREPSRSSPIMAGGHDRSGAQVAVSRPAWTELDPITDTLYVSDLDTGAFRVVDARSCNARRQHCKPPVATFVGVPDLFEPLVDPATKTLYLTRNQEKSGDASLAVVDLRHCTARDTSGCAGPSAPIPLPVNEGGGLALDPSTHSLYVGSFTTAIHVFDTRACTGAHPAGCTAQAVITAGSFPVFPLADPSTQTLYVANPGSDDTGNTMSVIDIRNCRAGRTSGCGQTPVTTRTAPAADFATIDYRTGTLYITSHGRANDRLSVIDQRRCNARNTTACSDVEPPSALLAPYSGDPVVSASSPTVYTASYSTDTLDVIDIRHCRARDTSGCRRPHPRIQTASGGVWWALMDQRTDSLYVTAVTAGVLQVIDARTCSALRTDGCRRESPAFAGAGGSALDAQLHTLYLSYVAPKPGEPEVLDILRLVDTRTCTIAHALRCRADMATARFPGAQLNNMVSDEGTSTLYIQTNDSILVVDETRCTSGRQDGCTPVAVVPVDSANVPHLNPKTHTVYVLAKGDRPRVVVIPGARCNRLDQSGCAEPPIEVAVDTEAAVPYVDPSSNTVYIGDPDELSLIDGAACDAGTTGCRIVATTKVPGVIALDFDPRTHTAYAPSFKEDRTGRIAVIDTRTCSARNSSGCGHTWPTTPTARGPFNPRFIPQTRMLFTTDIFGATVSLTDTRRCNAMDSSRCAKPSREIAVGNYPVVSYADARHNTLYVINNVANVGDYQGPATSLINLTHPCRSGRCFHA